MFYETSLKRLQATFQRNLKYCSHRLELCLFWRQRRTREFQAVLGSICCFHSWFWFFLSEILWIGRLLVTLILCLLICTECYFFNSTSWYAVFYKSIVLKRQMLTFLYKEGLLQSDMSSYLDTTCNAQHQEWWVDRACPALETRVTEQECRTDAKSWPG